MAKDYRDHKSLGTEDEGDLPVGRGFGSRQSWGRRVCPGRRLILVLLGILGVLAVAVMAFGFAGRKFGADLSEIQEDLKTINRTVFSQLAALKKNEADAGKALTKINWRAKNLTEEVKEARAHFQEQISKMKTSLHKLNCELEDTKHNRSGPPKGICCPKSWLSFSRNCYWFSNGDKSWPEAKADCEDKDAHLAIITSYLEQQFVAQHTKPRHSWIGLSLANHTWKWVDGTTYTMRRIDWRPLELGNFYLLSPEGSPECAHLYSDGLWTYNHCAQRLSWVCEMEAKA